MTTTVTITTVEGENKRDVQVVLTDEALARARRSFNPSGNQKVDTLKCLAAAFYTELQGMVDSRHPVAGREAATAATHIQAGAMFAVSAATA